MFLAANLSTMFLKVPLVARFAVAAKAGFEAVEIQFPYTEPLDTLRRAQELAGVSVELINVPAGHLVAGEVGLAALPGREEEFRATLEQCALYAQGLGVKKVNVLAGKIERTAETWAVLTKNLRFAAERLGDLNLAVQIEPLNLKDNPGFFLSSLADGLIALARADHPNLQLQFDLYHMVQTEPSLTEAIRRAAPHIGHVQFADTPGRHEPGTGIIDFEAALTTLREIGYDDCLAAEYRPQGRTEDGLGWRADFARYMI